MTDIPKSTTILIVGGGPGGSSIASVLTREGKALSIRGLSWKLGVGCSYRLNINTLTILDGFASGLTETWLKKDMSEERHHRKTNRSPHNCHCKQPTSRTQGPGRSFSLISYSRHLKSSSKTKTLQYSCKWINVWYASMTAGRIVPEKAKNNYT